MLKKVSFVIGPIIRSSSHVSEKLSPNRYKNHHLIVSPRKLPSLSWDSQRTRSVGSQSHWNVLFQVAPHKEDLAFLEHAESAFASTKNRFAEVLESSTAAAQQIQDALAALSALLSARAAQTPNPEAAVARDAAASEDDASTSGAEIRKSPEMSVRAIAELDRVRNLMVPRARFLNCLKSDVPGGQITLSLDEASGSSQLGAPASGQMDPPKIKATGDGKGPGKTSPEAAKKGATKSGGKTTPAGGKKRVSTDREAAEAEEFDTSTLTGQIKKLLSDCRTKLGDACREYYAKLEESDREPTRGARILEDAAAMAELHERTLAQIEWEGEEHRGAAVTRLRAQVRHNSFMHFSVH